MTQTPGKIENKSVGYISFGWGGENREIKLVVKDGKWYTVHSIDGKPDTHMIKTFGTNELPSPFAATVEKATVVQEIQARNRRAKIS